MKKLFSILFCFVLLSCLPLFAKAAGIGEVYTLQQNGMSAYWADAEGAAVSFASAADMSQPEDVGAPLPASYCSPAVTAVKDQDITNACWAFSVLSVLESDYVLNGYGTVADTDFSESHLTYFANNSLRKDPTDPTSGDGTFFEDPFAPGGSFLMAINALARGAGVVTEKKYPFHADTLPTYTSSQMYACDVRMENAYFLTEQADIKRAITENGGVAVCFYADAAGLSSYSVAPYKHPATGKSCSTVTTFYSKGIYAPNHGVVIVGWDDTFSRTNFGFLSRPAKNGAWLCKNSWGSNWGDGGYCWISYEDTTLTDFTTLTVFPDNRFDSIAQYDGYGYNNLITVRDTQSACAANVFRASEACALRAVGFHTVVPDLDYTVHIYRNVPENGFPTDGILALSVTGHAAYGGYHTVFTGTDVPLAADERYAVVVEFSATDGQHILIPVEGRTTVINEVPCSFASDIGTSFIGCLDDGERLWIDTSEAGYNNTCVKACLVKSVQTDSGMTRPVTLTDAKTGVRLTYDAADFADGAHLEMQVTEDPVSAGLVVADKAWLYQSAQAAGYRIVLTVSGIPVKRSVSGFVVSLPMAAAGYESVRAAQLFTDSAVQTLVCDTQAVQDGLLQIRTATLDGSFLSISANENADRYKSTAVPFDFLQKLLSFFRKLVAVFENVFRFQNE